MKIEPIIIECRRHMFCMYELDNDKLITNSMFMIHGKKYPMTKDEYDKYIIKHRSIAKGGTGTLSNAVVKDKKTFKLWRSTCSMLSLEARDRRRGYELEKEEFLKKRLYEEYKLLSQYEATKTREENLDKLAKFYKSMTFNDVSDHFLNYPRILAKKIYLVFDATFNIGLEEGFKSFVSLVRCPFTKEKTNDDYSEILQIAKSVFKEIAIIEKARMNFEFEVIVENKLGKYPFLEIKPVQNVLTDDERKKNDLYLKLKKEILNDEKIHQKTRFIEKIIDRYDIIPDLENVYYFKNEKEKRDLLNKKFYKSYDDYIRNKYKNISLIRNCYV